MIQLAALPAQITTATLPGIKPEAGGEPAETGAFADLLALTQDAAGGTEEAQPSPLASLAVAVPAAKGGKILPVVAGTVAALPVEPAPELPADAEEQVLAPQKIPVPALMASLKAIRAALPAQPGPVQPGRAIAEAPAREQGEDDAAPADEGTIEIAAIALTLTKAPAEAGEPAAAQPQAQASALPEPRAVPAGLPQAIAAQMQGLPLRPDNDKVQVKTAGAEAPVADAEKVRLLPVSAMAPERARTGAFTIEGGSAAPSPHAVTLRPQLDERIKPDAAALAAPAGTDPLAVAASAASPDITAAPTGAAPAISPSPSGHDFAALVDRLIAARDAARPEGVNVAVHHAEFGQVSLHFRQDEGGLSVSMASADPDFAAAVQAAVPPPAASAESAGTGAGAGQDGAAQGFARGDATTGQQGRGQPQEQAAARADARSGEARRQAAGSDDNSTSAQRPAPGRGRFA